MKVYDWKLLILTVIIGFGGMLYYLFDLFNDGGIMSVLWIALFAVHSYQGLRAALTEEGHLKDKENVRRSKIVSQRLFGRFAPLVLSGYFILLVASVVILFRWPLKIRLALWIFVRALIYATVIIILTFMEEEKLKAEENAEKAEK
ncbi:MAG: hypothetical protein IJ410_01290 [Oscillospiraceae bacterium]|nr:hypothetical protein [Oscillospiraceae bacterium]